MKLNKKALAIILLSISLLINFAFRPFDEGMFPLSELRKLDLDSAGLRIDQQEIYNPGDTSLVDALVKLGGCTGSFVSAEGLILTNHHCAFGAVQQASTLTHDYLNLGFMAKTRQQEIEAKGLTCRITDSYEDVSEQVLQAISAETDPLSRTQIIQQQMRQIAAEAMRQDSTIQAEVSEMFTGKSYVLFRYKLIRDVRLVYVPRRSIGEFGGETDNWMWPRHTGDFAFMRAYVAPDGSPAPYAKDNVPYRPKKFLKINPQGVNEEDFVFILGYPGRTFRHQPASFSNYQQQYLLPYISSLYAYQNKVMKEISKKDKEAALKLSTRIQRNANILKNYQGKLKGMQAIKLVAQKEQEDEALDRFIHADSALKQQYGTLLTDIRKHYQFMEQNAYRNLWLGQIHSSTSILAVARQINGLKSLLESNPSGYKEHAAGMERKLKEIYSAMDVQADKSILTRMLTDASNLPRAQRVAAVDKQVLTGFNKQEQINRFVASLFKYTRLSDQQYVLGTLLKSPHLLRHYNDKVLIFENEINNQMQALKPVREQHESELNQLMADYITVSGQFRNDAFIPDANGTLRLTYGYIRGYTPLSDTVYMKPFTTIGGIIEKGKSNNPEYQYPDKIRELWQTKDFGPFVKNDLEDVPVNMLYNLDTTGGNSGSPVMNAYGELVGLNFDRAQEATINDFAWNESYSRSIGVDIRYILWATSKLDGANFILQEMGINP